MSIFDPEDQLMRQPLFLSFIAVMIRDVIVIYSSMNNPAFLRAGRSAM